MFRMGDLYNLYENKRQLKLSHSYDAAISYFDATDLVYFTIIDNFLTTLEKLFESRN